MAVENQSEKSPAESETPLQQSILQQAEAVATAPIDPSILAGQEALLRDIDLLEPETDEYSEPAPAYDDTHVEIRNEKDGFGTSTRVTDDGRVDIRISQFNHRLSRIFNPALRQQVQTVQESTSPSLPYVPPSLGGGQLAKDPPPPLNVVIHVVGSRGDVQPFVALAKVLKNAYGHRVRLATHAVFRDFVLENGLEFFNIGGDPSQLMAFMVNNSSLMPGLRTILSGDINRRKRDVAEYIQGCWRSCYQAGDGMALSADPDTISGPESRPFVADCIIANPPSFAHIHIAEKLGIPLHIMFTMPYSPTQSFPHPLANIQSNADPQVTNYVSYTMIELLIWQGLGGVMNRFRAKCLGLDPVSLTWAPGMLHRLKIPHTYCWSPTLIPKPKDWASHISISGFSFLHSTDYTPSPNLQAFLDAGPPVYIGFGSIVLDDPNAMTELILEAAEITGQRILLSKGWGGMGAEELKHRIPDNVFMLGNVPHGWLFKHVSCVVHHGGAGTTAAGIAAGRPTVVVPFFGDQPFWGAMVARAGAGPPPIPHKLLTAENLANAINFCLNPKSVERAKELGSKIAIESSAGSSMCAQSFHQFLDPDRLRCFLAPSRAAVWRIKRTKIRLSAFAACTLANANLLDFHDLKLYRAQEYETDEGPWDPISGGFVAACEAFGGMAMGLASFPSETIKGLQAPFKSGREKSPASEPASASASTTRQRETTSMSIRSTPITSPEQSQTSLNVPQTPDRTLSSSAVSFSTTSDKRQNQSSYEQDSSSGVRVRSRVESRPGKEKDLIRRNNIHTSRGMGQFSKALVQSPMELSMGLTKGCHNLPKLWGDDTVRPHQTPQISDFMTGAKAAGKGFGLGWYDGVTGIVTQPWRGARKEGASGFVKGAGKGVGGFFAKSMAGTLGILSYSMKGVHKEVQKMFGSSVQNYIIASRAAQGYEEWLQSSDAEKQDVIERWKLIQKLVKKGRLADDTIRDLLESHRKANTNTSANTQDSEFNEPAAQTRGHAAADVDPEGAQENNTRPSMRTLHDGKLIQSHREERAVHQEHDEDLLRALAASESEYQRHAGEALEHAAQIDRVMAQSRWDQARHISDSDSDLASNVGLNDDEEEEFERTLAHSKKMDEAAARVEQDDAHLPSYDQGHQEGTSQSSSETRHQLPPREKTTQERTEEEIVMEYVKKQSLLEAQHRGKGKGRATMTVDEDDEELRQALQLSMQVEEEDNEAAHK